MSKHTPGPWRDEGYRISAQRGETTVVDLRSCMGGDDVQADARLIAAAPELLAALQKIAASAECEVVERIAREAIAKATMP